MSKKQPGIPRTLRMPMPANGPGPDIAPDLVWDNDNPPKVYMCSQDVKHHPRCDGSDELITLTKSQTDLFNEARAFARAGMSFVGVPAAYQNVVPVNGIKVELVDLLMMQEVLIEIISDLTSITEDELQERFREHKVTFIRSVREANEANVRRARAASALGIVKKPLLGPDGEPL